MQRTGFLLAGAALVLAVTVAGQPAAHNARVHRGAGTAPDGGPFAAAVAGFATSDAPVAVQSIMGVPGAALLSSPLPLPDGITRVRFAPGQRYAIGTTAGGSVILPFDGAAAATPIPLPGVAAADEVVFSPGGTAAIVAAGSRLQVVAGLPGTPGLVRGLAPDASDAGFAVSDDGAVVLEAEGDGSVWLLDAGGAKTRLYSALSRPAVAFLPRTHDAAVCDPAAGRFVVLQKADGAATSWVVADGAGSLGSNLRLAATRDGRRLIAAAPDAGSITLVDLQSLAVISIPVPAAPAQLEAMRAGDTFLVSAEKDMPAWILNVSGGQAALSFVGRPHTSRSGSRSGAQQPAEISK